MKSNHFSSVDGSGLRVAIIASRFNQELCDALAADAVAALHGAAVAPESIDIVRVPGSFELPVMANKLASSKKYDAIICLGVLIKGDTKHDQYIANAVAQGLTLVSIQTGIPVAFGVLTTETKEQAEVRALGSQKKGWEAAMSVIETVRALQID